jgi:hypothetical protein
MDDDDNDDDEQTVAVRNHHETDNDEVASQAPSLSSTASEKEPTIFDMIKKKAAESAVRAGLTYLFASLNYLKNKMTGTQEEGDDDDDAGGDAAQDILDELHGDGAQEVSNIAQPPQGTPPGPM